MSADGGTAIPTATQLIAAARAMIPTLKERAQRQADNRRLLPETVADMKAAGLFRVPKVL